MSFRSLLTHRCTIERNTPANTDGELRASWADNATDVPCLIQEGRGRVQGTQAGEGLQYDAIGFFLPDADIKPQGGDDRKDRITVTTPVTNVKYLVEKVGDEAGRANHLTAYLTRVPTAS